MFKYELPDGKIKNLKQILWKYNRRLVKTLLVCYVLLLVIVWKSYLLFNYKLVSTAVLTICFIVICAIRNRQISKFHYVGFAPANELTQVDINDF